MADIVLGARTKSLEVLLTKDADFFTTLETEDGSDWPVGAIIRLTLGSAVFEATLDGPNAHLSIDSDDVNEIISGRTRNILAKLFYIDNDTPSPICWAVGQVNANG